MRNKKKIPWDIQKVMECSQSSSKKEVYSNKCWTKEIRKSQKINFATQEIRIRKTNKAPN